MATTKFVALLRGINVSGKNLIKMEDLRKAMLRIGYVDVLTYIQSGNIIFLGTPKDAQVHQQRISKMIASEFGIQIPILVLPQKKLQAIVEGNPMLQQKKLDVAFMHCTLFDSSPSAEACKVIAAQSWGGDVIEIVHDVAYIYCPEGYGRTKLTNTFLEKKLNVSATTRNWKTMCVLAEM